jgi:hypothetical protein
MPPTNGQVAGTVSSDSLMCMSLCASSQAGRIGSAAVMQLSEHDMEIYTAAHPHTEVI